MPSQLTNWTANVWVQFRVQRPTDKSNLLASMHGIPNHNTILPVSRNSFHLMKRFLKEFLCASRNSVHKPSSALPSIKIQFISQHSQSQPKSLCYLSLMKPKHGVTALNRSPRIAQERWTWKHLPLLGSPTGNTTTLEFLLKAAHCFSWASL